MWEVHFKSKVMHTIKDFLPSECEVGASIIFKDPKGRYRFIISGKRYSLKAGEIFYCGVGGHLEGTEGYSDCAIREAKEEIGVNVKIENSKTTWIIMNREPIRRVSLSERFNPFAIYQMEERVGQNKKRQPYYIIIFQASIPDQKFILDTQEALGIINVYPEQLIENLERKLSLKELLLKDNNVGYCTELPLETLFYPIGTAKALGIILKQIL